MNDFRLSALPSRLLAQAVALAVPPRCLACGASCPAGERICDACRCELAQLPAGGRADRRGPWLRSHFAAFPMAGAARALVHALKFRGGAGAATEMARLIECRAKAGLFAEALLVPVPAHPLRERERGYNQSALLARELARLTGAPVADCLVRSPRSPAQTGLPRHRRLALDPASIHLRPGRPLFANGPAREKTNVVLLDDVTTTGVTLEICASAIGKRTAAPVGAVTFAATGARPGEAPIRSHLK